MALTWRQTVLVLTIVIVLGSIGLVGGLLIGLGVIPPGIRLDRQSAWILVPETAVAVGGASVALAHGVWKRRRV